MKKRLILCIFCLLALLLVACSNTPSSSSDGADVSDTTSTSGITGDTIRIGWFGPLSGPVAENGINSLNTTKLVIKEINASGGINDKLLELIPYDDEGLPENAVKVVTRLIEQDKVVGVIGSHLSGAVLAVSDITEKSKIILVGCGTSSIWTNIGLKYTFRGTVNSDLFNEKMYHVMKEDGCKTIAIIAEDTEYAQTVSSVMRNWIDKDTDLKLVAFESYTTGDTDFSGQLIKVQALRPDALYVLGGGESLGNLIAQARIQGYTDHIYGVEGLSDNNALEMAGDAYEGVVFGCAYVVPDKPELAISDIEKKYLEAYLKEYGTMPTVDVAYRAYDSMNLLAEAIKQAGSLDGDSLRKAFLTMKYTGIAGSFDFSSDTGDGIDTLRVYTYSDGRYQDYYEWKKNE